jgi:hypothetical protein
MKWLPCGRKNEKLVMWQVQIGVDLVLSQIQMQDF